MIKKEISIQNIKLVASLFFIVIGLLSLIDTLRNKPEYYLRDLVILLILSSPLLINRRIYYMIFGLLTSVSSLLILMFYAVQRTPFQIKETTFLVYLSGCLLYLSALVCSITLIYIGTYSKDRNKFELV